MGGPLGDVGISTNPAVIAKERFPDSRRWTGTDGRERRRRVFWVYPRDPDNNGLAALDETEAFRNVGIRRGDDHPLDDALQAADWRVREREEQRGTWEVEWIYKPLGAIPDLDDPDKPGYAEINLDFEAQFIDVWRTEVTTFPEFGGVEGADPATFIIEGGRPVDSAGEPVSFLNRQMILTFTHVVEGFPNTTNTKLATGRRNLVPFQGAEIGRVLYLGASTTRVTPGIWRIHHEFVWDEFYHLRQKFLRQFSAVEDDNQPQAPTLVPLSDIIGNDPPIPPEQDWAHAAPITWVQPFPQFADFEAALQLPPI